MSKAKRTCTEQVILATYDIQFKLNERLPLPMCMKKLNFGYLVDGSDVSYMYTC